MSSIKVTVGVVPFGGVKYLPYSLKSLLDQDYPNVEYLLLDQEEGKYTASRWIEKEHPEWLSKMNLWQGPNLWHGGGMNKLIASMSGEIFIVASQDMLYPPDMVSKIVKFFQDNPGFDFATCRLYRWDFEKLEKTNTIDSLGLKITTKHSAYEIGQGREAGLINTEFDEIFGGSGALLILTKEAIEKVKVDGQVFDENLHYKNDVDLAYRLQWAGCRGAILNSVIVYHDRFINSQAKKPFWVKRQSLLGDLVFIKKNFSWQYSLLTILKTWLYIWAKCTFLTITNPKLLGVYLEIWKMRASIKKWRASIDHAITPKQMEQKLKQ